MTVTNQKQEEYIRHLLQREPKSEIQLQSKCSELLYWFYPSDWQRLVCVNNNDRKANTSNVGIVPGASDMYYLLPEGRVLLIEFKFGNKSHQSEKQVRWEELATSLGHSYVICRDEQTFWNLVGFKQPELSDVIISY